MSVCWSFGRLAAQVCHDLLTWKGSYTSNGPNALVVVFSGTDLHPPSGVSGGTTPFSQRKKCLFSLLPLPEKKNNPAKIYCVFVHKVSLTDYPR